MCSSSSMTCEANDVWVFGYDVNLSAGTINPIGMHFDGQNWTLGPDLTPINSGRYGYQIWGNQPSNYWAVGDKGNIFEYAGSATWITCSISSACPGSGVTADLSAIHGIGPGDVWASGGGVTLHYEGAQWIPRNAGLPTNQSAAVSWAAASDDVWATTPSGVAHWNGTIWTVDSTVSSIYGIWGSASNDVWAVGTSAIRHWDGSTWSQSYAVDNQAVNSNMLSISDIWYWDGTAWTLTPLAAAQKKAWLSVFGSANGGR
jgi:hypothetical protein